MKITSIFVLSLSLLTSFAVANPKTALPAPRFLEEPLPRQFDSQIWRHMFFELAEDPKIEKARVRFPPEPTSAEGKLIDFYVRVFEPQSLQDAKQERIYVSRKLLLDSGLLKPHEIPVAEQEMAAALAYFSKMSTDEEWRQKQLHFGELANGLKGDLADLARQLATSAQLEMHPPHLRDLVTELNQLDEDIDQIANRLDANIPAGIARREGNKVVNAYHKGELSLLEAQKQLESWTKKDAPAIGRELVTKAADKLTRVAQLRSQLAKEHGFKNWADYQLAVQAQAHSPGYRTPEEMVQFLEGLLSATDDVALAAYQTLAKNKGVEFRQLRPSGTYLLLPPADFHLYGFFARRSIESLWRKTMKESGFPDSLTRRVIVDAFPRQGKQNHAYMMPAQTAYTKSTLIDGRSLNFIEPAHDYAPEWVKAVTAIVQNFRDDDLDNLGTMFHEGGHGLDYAARRNSYSRPRSAGHAETHSTTMEHFLQDREFLLANARNQKGEKVSEQKVDQYLSESAIKDLIGFRGSVMQSLFDIELWRYDYTQPGAETMWERATRLNKELFKRTRFIDIPEDQVADRGFSFFSTGHFYGGRVSYSGYVMAAVAAEIVASDALDRLEKSTGRRSLYKQPELAEILTTLYKNSAKEQFPLSLEQHTGRPFSPLVFAKDLNRRVLDALAKMGCDQFLDPIKTLK